MHRTYEERMEISRKERERERREAFEASSRCAKMIRGYRNGTVSAEEYLDATVDKAHWDS